MLRTALKLENILFVMKIENLGSLRKVQLIIAILGFPFLLNSQIAFGAKKFRRQNNTCKELLVISGVSTSIENYGLVDAFHRKTIKEINDFINPLDRPCGPLFLFSCKLDYARPGQGGASLEDWRLTTSPLNISQNISTRTNTDPITAHEYGHFIFEHNLRLRQIIAIRRRYDPFAELFSDLVAVLHADNPAAMLQENPLLGSAHDFLGHKESYDEPQRAHPFFEQTRHFIGRAYFLRANKPWSKGEFLALVFEAIAQEIVAKKRSGKDLQLTGAASGQDHKIDPFYPGRIVVEYNLDLIDRLKRILATTARVY